MDLRRFSIPAGEPDPVWAIIQRRRRQLIVHSILYYRYDTSVISDATWDAWGRDLVELEAAFPEIAATVPYHEEFRGFDGSTGYFLPLDDPSCKRVALRLLQDNKDAASAGDT